MKKRILFLVLAVLLVLSLTTALAPPAYAAEDYNGVYVSEWWGDFGIHNYMGNLLVAYRGSGGDVVIPDGVEVIYASAFEDNTDITSVTIPNSVTDIR